MRELDHDSIGSIMHVVEIEIMGKVKDEMRERGSRPRQPSFHFPCFENEIKLKSVTKLWRARPSSPTPSHPQPLTDQIFSTDTRPLFRSLGDLRKKNTGRTRHTKHRPPDCDHKEPMSPFTTEKESFLVQYVSPYRHLKLDTGLVTGGHENDSHRMGVWISITNRDNKNPESRCNKTVKSEHTHKPMEETQKMEILRTHNTYPKTNLNSGK